MGVERCNKCGTLESVYYGQGHRHQCPPCLNPEHHPPMHLYIPPGSSYTHICPGCGYRVVLAPPQISC